MNSPDILTGILASYIPISLEEMSAVRLMNRIDTKYLTSIDVLRQLLERLSNEYYIQDEDGTRLFPYHTLYFDTDTHRMYMMHLAGKKVRQKIRMRTYESTGSHFLEIKKKNNKGRTKKKRISIAAVTSAVQAYDHFIDNQSAFKAADLIPHLENNFKRITLVNQQFTERLTIDVGLKFHSLLNNNALELENMAVIELKRDGAIPSPALKHFNALRIKPSGFSKYCMGMVFTLPEIKANRFKERKRYVLKIINKNNLI